MYVLHCRLDGGNLDLSPTSNKPRITCLEIVFFIKVVYDDHDLQCKLVTKKMSKKYKIIFRKIIIFNFSKNREKKSRKIVKNSTTQFVLF
jgi:hypothetical protein